VFLKQFMGQPKYISMLDDFQKQMCNGKLLDVSISFEAIDKNGGGGVYMDWNGLAEDPDLPAMKWFAVSAIQTTLSH
jgi:hypothetical protein